MMMMKTKKKREAADVGNSHRSQNSLTKECKFHRLQSHFLSHMHVIKHNKMMKTKHKKKLKNTARKINK